MKALAILHIDPSVVRFLIVEPRNGVENEPTLYGENCNFCFEAQAPVDFEAQAFKNFEAQASRDFDAQES